MEEGITNITRMKGGKRNMVNKKELEIGTKIEKKEHGVSLKVAKKIASDHIGEFPTYYTDKEYGLIAVEKKLKSRKRKRKRHGKKMV